MRLPTVTVVLAVLAVAGPAQAWAQRPYRSGFWFENGVGTGTIRIGCSNCAEPTVVYGQSSYVRTGGTVSRHVAIGLELFTLLDKTFGVAAGDSSLQVENVSIGPVVLWYPWKSGLFLKGGVGVAHGEVFVTDTAGGPSTTLASGIGSGVTFGAGFDIPLFKWLSVTANFGIYYTALGDVTVQGTYNDDVITSMYNANFAFTIR